MASKEVTNAAKAIYESRNGARCKPWSQLPQSHQSLYLDDAEAARKSFLADLQEPNEVMTANGYVHCYNPARTWCAMLNASPLGEKAG